MHFRDTIDLAAPPVGYNPSILKSLNLRQDAWNRGACTAGQ